MNFNKLKEEGWIILRESGTFNNNKVVIYTLSLIESEKSYLTKCVLNFKAVSELRKQFGFNLVKSAKRIIYCNKPDGYKDFSTQTKEALK